MKQEERHREYGLTLGCFGVPSPSRALSLRQNQGRAVASSVTSGGTG